MSILCETLRDPEAWNGRDFSSKGDVTVWLQPEHLTEIDEAVREALSRGRTLATMERGDFALPRTASLLAEIGETLKSGRGIVVLRGINIARYSQAELELIYWGLGTHWGEGISQSVMGDRLGHVRDFTQTDPNARAYRNKQELTPHTDLADIVGLMCLKTARSGGVSIATSALAVHNELVRRAPQYLAPLHEGFFYHRRGEQGPGQASVTPHRIPVFSWHAGQLSCRYVRSYIETAAKEGHVELTTLQRDALDELERLTYELAFEFSLEPGDIYLINNYTVLHARTAFEDWPEPERKRHLLRLWLVSPGFRSLAPGVAEGRHGVAAQAGKTPSYAGAVGQGRIATR
jgi:hypothetical protein